MCEDDFLLHDFHSHYSLELKHVLMFIHFPKNMYHEVNCSA